MRVVAFVLFLLASPAAATTDAWPALHDVIGVEAGDVLNVRAGPGTEFDIIATLEPEAIDIEVIRPSEDFAWGLVVIGEGMGWVSLSFLAPQLGQWDGMYPSISQCYGTEPFWSLTSTSAAMSFEGLDLPAYSAPVEFEGAILNHRGRFSFKAGDMVGVLSNAQCNDGMSEREFGWELNLVFLTEGTHFQGCCSIAPLAE